jgi:pimeloyl-ACP methyl ester carboxylesterase
MTGNDKERTIAQAASGEDANNREGKDLSRRRFIRAAATGAAALTLNAATGSRGSSKSGFIARKTEMNASEFHNSRKFVATPFGRIAYVERGSGPVALFIHGWPLNGYHWRDIITNLSDVRRCIALDTMGLGHTEISPDQNLAFTEQARMVEAFLDALKIDRIDLVGNDSGGGISQMFAVRAPDRIRSLTLTNCEVHDNSPSPGLAPIIEAAKAGALKAGMKGMLANPAQARAAFAQALEHPERLAEETIQTYLQPLVASEEKGRNMERFILSLDHQAMVAIEDRLKKFNAPTLILWGAADTFFPVKWAYWLKNTIPGAREVIEVKGAKLFFPEEHPRLVSEKLRAHWSGISK